MLRKVLSFNIYWINFHLDFIMLSFEYLYKIIFLCRILFYNYLCRVVLKLSWYSNGISVFNHQFVYHKILKNKDITDMQNTQKLFLSKYTSQHFSYTGCYLCPTNVSAYALKLPPSQKSVFLETGVLTRFVFYYNKTVTKT